MSGHLCLKWNNHSTAFIKSISNIQIKERYCDATIACQGKYFPVHRVVLSTCSDYFDEIFERIDCPHPYIIFKDIEPREMELLLNYMYQGEVNVIQEHLPMLIKAAEALKVKGLAVPDDLPASKDSSSKKRSSDAPLPKRRSEEKRRRRDSSDHISQPNSSSNASDRSTSKSDIHMDNVEGKVIKEEPIDSSYENPSLQRDYGEAGFSGGSDSTTAEAQQGDSEEKSDSGVGVFVEFPTNESENFIKTEDPGTAESYNEEQSSWSDFTGSDIMPDLPETSTQDDISHYLPTHHHHTTGLHDDAGSRSAKVLQQQHQQQRQQQCHGVENRPISMISIRRSPSEPGLKHHCPMCPYASNSKQNVRNHIMFKHTGERPFLCDVCPKRFTLKQHLRLHLRTHTGERPHKCSVCPRSFTQKGHLRSHIRSHHC